ncbi:MAG: hypothetical protein LBJ75_03825, partial [Puniceicoccales bacterium]|nr:hypothetical protein [Puniceicoccales bacterium]
GVNTGAMTTAPQALNGVNIQPAVFKAVEETSARSLLGKVAALGRSAWALAIAHPVIATMAVVAAIAIPTLIIAWRKNKEKNVIMPRSNEVPQSNEIAQSDKSSGVP